MSDSIRDALTSAFDAAEADEAEPIASTSDDAVDETPTDDTPDTAGAESASDSGPGASPTNPVAAPAPSSPAPQSWSAEAKAAWASLPATAQNEIRRRETELNKILQTSASSRKAEAEFNEMFSPYDDLIKAHGATRLSVIQPMLASRYLLETGTPAQKAEFAVNMIRDFNIPIELLDQALTQLINQSGGQMPYRPAAPVQPQPDVRALIQEALDQDPVRQAYKARQTQAAEAAIDAVRTHPQFEEVKLTVADVLEQAHNAGRELTLEQAFDIGLRMHGHSTGYVSQSAQQLRDQQGRFAASKRAASSVSGAPVATQGYKPGTGSIRDELMNALQNAK